MEFTRSVLCALLVALLFACGGGGGGSGGDDGGGGSGGGGTGSTPDTVAVDPARMPFVTGLRCTGAQLTGWCWQRPQPDGNATRDVQFADASNGWVVGDYGTLRRTSDGGVTWLETAVATRANFRSMRFFDARIGWALTETGQVWRTLDGGATWQLSSTLMLTLPLSRELLVQGPNTLVANGRRNVILSDGTPSTQAVSMLSRDGGASWTDLSHVVTAIDTDGTLWGTVWGAVPDAGLAKVSSDLGTTWRTPAAGYPAEGRAPTITASGFAWELVSVSQSLPSQLYQRVGPGDDWVRTEVRPPASDELYYAPSVTMAANGTGLMRILSGPDSEPRYARSADAGRTWTWIDLPVLPAGWEDAIRTELIADARTLLVRFNNFDNSPLERREYLSTDAGRTWRQPFPEVNEPNQNQYGVRILRRDLAGALLANVQTSSNRWLRSTDDGLTWRELPGTTYANEGFSTVLGLQLNADGSGLAVSRGGPLLDTVDGGRHWTERAAASFGFVNDFAAFADGRYFVVADGLLHRSADRGRTWTPLSPLPQVPGSFTLQTDFERVLFAEGNLLRVVVAGPCDIRSCARSLYSSADAGLTWQAGRRIAASSTQVTITFISANVAVRVEGPLLQRSTDGGETWINASAPPVTLARHQIRFVDAQNGWVVGPDSRLLRTRDGGMNWVAVTVPAASANGPAAPFTFNDIAFAPGATNGWIVGAGGVLLATRDGGSTWELQPSGTTEDLMRVQAIDNKTVWAGGVNGAILVSASGGRVAP